MKRQGFIYNKVMVQLVVTNVDKASWIPHTNVIPPTFEGDDGDNLWWVQSQQHPNVIYKICAPFTKYTSCTYEWALWSNFCKHKIIILLICINLTTKNIIEYYDTYFGIHCDGLKSMFANQSYLQLDDGVSNDDNYNQNHVDEINIVDIEGFATTYEDGRCDNVNVPKGSSTPMDQALTCLHKIMVKIIIECDEGVSIKLYDHVILFF